MTAAVTAVVLRTAADLIDEHGWTRGSAYRYPDGRRFDLPGGWKPGCAMCVLGAIYLAADESCQERVDAVNAIEEQVGLRADVWNDVAGQSAERVVAELRDAAARLEREDDL